MPPGSTIAQAAPGTAAPLPVVLIGGRVIGVWDRKPRGKRLQVRVDPHQELTPRQRAAVAEQAERVAAILELACDLEFTSLSLRFHL